MDADRFREAMSRLASGVCVVAAPAGAGFRGMTVTSLTSVSDHPPRVLVVLDGFTATLEAVVAAGAFSVSVLDRRHEFISDRLSGRAPAVHPAWSDVPHRVGDNGGPVIEGSVAWLECTVGGIHPAGDHTIVVGEVTAAGAADGEPLVLWDRRFWRIGH